MKDRVLFLGMGGEYSRAAMEGLLTGGLEVAAVVFPRAVKDEGGLRWLPAAAQRVGDMELAVRPVRGNILALAGERGIPVLEVGSMRDTATLDVIRELQPGLAVTACFPQILPQEFLEVPRLGCLNIHPSLLPGYRGPEPLFWQFRTGEQDTGVTVHWMDAGADTGPVMAQRRLQFPEGVRMVEVERMAGQAGAEMIVAAVMRNEYPRVEQAEVGASYQGMPHEEDKVIPVTWGVKRAFNFMRGADAWAPFWIEGNVGERLEVREALGYELGATIEQGVIEKEGDLRVQMGDGVLLAN